MADVINSYHNNFSGGIGDFIKGSIYLYSRAKKHGLSIDIDWKYHPIGQFISSRYEPKYDPKYILDIEDLSIKLVNPYGHSNKNWKDNTEDWIEYILSKISQDQQLRPSTISSWYSHTEKINDNKINAIYDFIIDNECKELLKNKINFSQDITTTFQNRTFKNYNIIHFRLGDRHTIPNIENKINNYDTAIRNNYNLKLFNYDYDYFYYLIQKDIKHNNLHNVIIMSDSNDFKKFIFEESKDRSDIHILHLNSAHTASKPGMLKYTDFYKETPINAYRDTVLDLCYIIHSQKNITYSFYPWGSGFVTWPSKLYDIPLKINILT